VSRPTLYQPEYVEQAYDACLLGATDEELAARFGVHVDTVYEWKKRYPEFSEAIKAGKRPADERVACALHSRATGAEWKEEQAIKLKRVEYVDGKRVLEEERVEVVEVTRRAPPDTTAGIFWLKNRKADDWRDKQEVQHSGNVLVMRDVDNL
jgi:transposase